MKPLLLVDGYNVIGAWDVPKKERLPIEEARDRLVHLIADYAGFSGEEVMARIHAILRRTERVSGHGALDAPLVFDNLSIHMADALVTIDSHPISLTKKELEILYTLAENSGKLFSREMLLSLLWGYDYYGDSRTVDSHVKRLRVKLDAYEHPHWQIKTIWGMGYKFEIIGDEK